VKPNINMLKQCRRRQMLNSVAQLEEERKVKKLWYVFPTVRFTFWIFDLCLGIVNI
jgi:hypothetical protein